MKYKLDGLITVEELARKLRKSPRAIYDWVAKRKVEFTRLEGRVYFHVDTVERMLQRNAVPAARQPPTLTEQREAQTGDKIE